MRNKHLWTGAGAFMGMLILILDGRTALEGARQGIELCLKTVIPSLFPFFLLSILLTSSFMGSPLPILRPLGWLCGIPKGAESLLVSGFLGGYPVGAQSVATAYRAGQLRKQEAERLLAFCNNAGPAFLFGMIAPIFPRQWMAWALWGIHIAGAIFAALLIPGGATGAATSVKAKQMPLSAALSASLRIMAAVCGWVVLFRVLITFLSRWILWLLPTAAQVAVTGLLELSNGCCDLLRISDISLRFLVCAGILAFGGLCVTMQTVSVTAGLSLGHYFPGKLLQTAFSLLLAGAVIGGVWLPCCAVLLTSAFLLGKRRKNSSIQAAVGV